MSGRNSSRLRKEGRKREKERKKERLLVKAVDYYFPLSYIVVK
jgi:hypothetical protein